MMKTDENQIWSLQVLYYSNGESGLFESAKKRNHSSLFLNFLFIFLPYWNDWQLSIPMTKRWPYETPLRYRQYRI
jgi:hypothetical protein